jgi:NDP-hexose-3-ketoreductase
MNSILFLGYSNLLRARILPIIESLNIDSVSIAKYNEQNWDDELQKYKYPITLYENYDDALNNFQGNIVYVSTVNSAHYKYALLSLEKGHNVIIDKPSTMHLKDALHLTEVAKQKKLLISEATVFLMHPQFSLIDKIYIENNDAPKLITAHFSMPPFKNDNFRYKSNLGGGAILDTSPYAVSLGRYFFKELPINAQCNINERTNDGLETEYSLLMVYRNGKCLIGHFGFNTEYINQLCLIGTKTNILINRAFTIPENLENTIQIMCNNVYSEKISKKGNNFFLYFEKFLHALTIDNQEEFYNNLLLDAQAREMIINSTL